MGKRSNRELGLTGRSIAAVLSAVLASGTMAPTLAWAAPPAAPKAAPKHDDKKPAHAPAKKDDKAAPKKDDKAAPKKDDKAAPKKDDKKSEEAKRAEARKHYAAAEEKFKAGDFAGAFTEYKAADDLLPAAITTYKMAVCLDKENKAADAVKGYEAFLAANPPASMQEKIDDAKARVADLEKKLPAAVKVTSEPAGASVDVDGVAQLGSTPLDLKLTAGHHKLRVSSPGYDAAEKDVDAKGGASQDISVTLTKSAPVPVAAAAPAAPVPAPAPAAPAADAGTSKRSNTAAYVLLGVAGAGVIVGSIFGVKALSAKGEFNDGTKTADQADKVERDALIADMAFGAALTLGVTGTVLLLSNGGSSAEAAQATPKKHALGVAPFVSPHAAGAGAFVSF